MPGKNIRMMGGKPLMIWTVDRAKQSGVFARIHVSTDSCEIQDIVVKAGYPCPSLRPACLAEDHTPMIDVLRHVLKEESRVGMNYDAVCLLQPTSPFRTVNHIKEAVSRFRESGADTLVSVTKVPHRFIPEKLMLQADGADRIVPIEENVTLSRYGFRQLWARNGPAILIVKSSRILVGNFYRGQTIGYKMPFVASIDIDEEEDWMLSEMLWEKVHVF